MIIEVNPVIDNSVIGLCSKPYPLHPKGCPNFNKRQDCPPKAPLWENYIDSNYSVFAIITEFDFMSHKNKMQSKHPEWSKRQVECCLYWQGTARKHLKEEIAQFNKTHPNYTVFITPEAMGVNITETMKNVGIELEWPPNNIVYKIALGAVVKGE